LRFEGMRPWCHDERSEASAFFRPADAGKADASSGGRPPRHDSAQFPFAIPVCYKAKS